MSKKPKLLSPVITMCILILIALFISSFLAIINFDGTQTTIENGMLETSIIVVKNIFSKEGLIYLFSNIITNFTLLEPFVLIILSLMAIGILKENMIYIAMEEDTKKRNEMSDELEKIILKYLVPVREKRKFNRDKNVKNRYHINKRKSF